MYKKDRLKLVGAVLKRFCIDLCVCVRQRLLFAQKKINGKNINHRFLLFEIRNNHYKRKNLISKTKWEEKKNQISGFWYRDYFTPKPLQNCFSAAIHNSIGISLMNGLVAWNRLNFV